MPMPVPLTLGPRLLTVTLCSLGLMILLDGMLNAVRGESNLHEKHLTLGTVALDRKDYDEALSRFEEALRKKPDDPRTLYYLGITLHRLERDREAVTAFHKAEILDPSLTADASYYLGIAYLRLGLSEDARDAFEETAEKAPAGSAIAGSSRDYLRKLPKRPPGEKAYTLSLLTGIQYDGNVILEPEEPIPTAGAGNADDLRGVASLRGDYAWALSRNWRIIPAYDFYQSLHADLHDFDIQRHAAEISVIHRSPSDVEAGGEYRFEYVTAGGERFLTTQTYSPVLTLPEGKAAAIQLAYRLQTQNFEDTSAFPGNAGRSGTQQTLSARQTAVLFRLLSLRFAGALEREGTETDTWDNTGGRLLGGFGCTSTRWQGDLTAEYTTRNYRAGRDDRTLAYQATLRVPWRRDTSMTANYTRIQNDSNEAIYRYDRDLFSLMIGVRF